jgi:hypothetical protein
VRPPQHVLFCIIIKINVHAFYALCGYFILLLLALHKFVKPNGRFTIKTVLMFVILKFVIPMFVTVFSMSIINIETVLFYIHSVTSQKNIH